jgi:hypothetical protein
MTAKTQRRRRHPKPKGKAAKTVLNKTSRRCRKKPSLQRGQKRHGEHLIGCHCAYLDI